MHEKHMSVNDLGQEIKEHPRSMLLWKVRKVSIPMSVTHNPTGNF